jgi:hypothetical protein
MALDNDVPELVRELTAVIGLAGPDEHSLRQAAKHISYDPEPLRRLFSAILADRAWATAIASDSYWHCSGFAKLNVHRHPRPEFRLRLHVWPDGSGPRPALECSNIHSHRSEFASVVLAGGLHVDEFEQSADLGHPETVPCHRFSYDAPAASGRLQLEGSAALRPTRSSNYLPMDTHYCGTDQLHIVAPFARTFTATTVVQGPTLGDAALVYQRYGRAPLEDTGAPLTTDEVVDLVGRTLDHLATGR